MRALIRSAALTPLLAYIVVSSAAAQPSPAAASSDVPRPAPTASADSAAETRLRQMLALIDSGDPAAARTFVEANFAPGLLREGGPAPFLAELARLHHTTGGLELHGILGIEEGRAMALVRARLTDTWWRFGVMVGPSAPHRVIGMGYGPSTPPEDARRSAPMADDELARGMDAYLRRLGEAGVFSGAVLVARDGRVVYRGAVGEANRDFAAPVTAETRFNLASLNKMFTAVAILQLAEAGKLSLFDSLAKHLPSFPNAEAARKIRIEHLLAHTAGLGDFFGPAFDARRPTAIRTLDDYLAVAELDSLLFEPGTEWRYSNAGYLVLGKVIEAASGQPYDDYVREHVWARAGMAATGFPSLDGVNPGLAVPYDPRYTEAGIEVRNRLLDGAVRGSPAGGGASTVDDLLRFAEALRGGRLLSAESLRLLTAPKPEIGSPRYGFGFEVVPEVGAWGHSGGAEGVSGNLDVFANGYVAVVLSNVSHGAEPVLMRIRDLVGVTQP